MKKFKSVSIIVIAAMIMCTALASCSFEEKLHDEETTVPTTVKIVEDTTAEAENDDVDGAVSDADKAENDVDSDSGKTNAALKQIVESYSFKSQVKTTQDMLKDKLKVEADIEGSTLVYKYTYVNHYSKSKLKSLKKSIKKSNLRPTAKNMVNSMVKAGYDDFKVSFRYYSKEGKLVKKIDFDKSVLG
jgi:hypothetical protein